MSLRRIALLMVGALAGVVLAAAPASAHATYEDSNPAKGAAVPSPPGEVWVQFSEGVEDGSKLEVFDECGDQVDNGDTRVTGTLSDTLTVSVSGDKAGAYTVTWSVVSADSHPVSGDYSFRSSGGASCPGDEPDDSGDGGGGGGNGGGSGGGGGSGDGSGDGGEPSSDDDQASGAESGPGGGNSGGAHANHQGDGGPKDKGGSKSNGGGNVAQNTIDDTQDGDGSLAAVNLAQEQESEEIPLDALLIGFGFAALLGAGGGIVYAGIVGPRD